MRPPRVRVGGGVVSPEKDDARAARAVRVHAVLSLRAEADGLLRAWEAGEICSLVGRGCRARLVRLERLVQAGLVPERTALALADVTVHVAHGVQPLQAPPP